MRIPIDRGGIRTWLLILSLAASLFLGTSGPGFIVAGTVVLLLSAVLQFWSKGCLQQNREVTWVGPYRFVRHPFYLANFLLDAGLVTMSGFWPLIVVGLAWWLAVYIPVMRSEEKHLLDVFGEEYREYMSAVPMLLPTLTPGRSGRGQLNWLSGNNIRTEIPRLLRYLCYPLLFVLAWQFSMQGPTITVLIADHGLVTATIIGLVAGSRLWKRIIETGCPVLPRGLARARNRVWLLSLIVLAGLAWDILDPNTESTVHWVFGIASLAVSGLAASSRPRYPLIAEISFVVAMIVILEMQWMIALVLPLYVGIVAGYHTPRRSERSGSVWEPMRPISHALATVIGVVVAIVSEVAIP